MRILKFSLEIKSEQVINMPYGLHVLSVQVQDRKLVTWVICDESKKEITPTKFYMITTGKEIGDDFFRHRIYISTVQIGDFVAHFFV